MVHVLDLVTAVVGCIPGKPHFTKLVLVLLTLVLAQFRANHSFLCSLLTLAYFFLGFLDSWVLYGCLFQTFPFVYSVFPGCYVYW